MDGTPRDGVLIAPIGAEKVKIKTAGSSACAAADIEQGKLIKW